MTANQEQMMMAAMQQGMQGQMQGPPPPPGPSDNGLEGDVVGDESPEAKEGRGGDTILAHLTPGEIVVPVQLVQTKKDLAILQKLFDRNGVDLNQYTAGHESNSINPETGYPEFGIGSFVKRTFKKATKAVGKALKNPGKALVDQTKRHFGYIRTGYNLASGKAFDDAREEGERQAAEAEANIAAQIAAYEKNIDAAVLTAKKDGAKAYKDMKAAGNVSNLKFQETVKNRMKKDNEAFMGESGVSLTSESGSVKGAAKRTTARKRVKRNLKRGGRPS